MFSFPLRAKAPAVAWTFLVTVGLACHPGPRCPRWWDPGVVVCRELDTVGCGQRVMTGTVPAPCRVGTYCTRLSSPDTLAQPSTVQTENGSLAWFLLS